MPPCLQSSVLCLHIHLQSSWWNAPTLTFWGSLSVHSQSTADSVLQHVGLHSRQRKAAIKGRESAARWLSHNKNTPFHSWMLKKKKSAIFSVVLSHLVLFPSYREEIWSWTDVSLCLFLSFVSLGNVDLIWAKFLHCHLANRKEGLDKDGRENLSGVKWKTLSSMCFMYVE